MRALESLLCASKRCPRHANARRRVGCAAGKVGCAPANVVRGMQMRVEKLPARLGKLAEVVVGVECRPERAAGRPGLFDALEVGVAWKLAQGTDSRV